MIPNIIKLQEEMRSMEQRMEEKDRAITNLRLDRSRHEGMLSKQATRITDLERMVKNLMVLEHHSPLGSVSSASDEAKRELHNWSERIK